MKSIVLLSGGIDSATALYQTLESNKGVVALTFDYERSQGAELRAAEKVARTAGVEHRFVELPFYKYLEGSPSASDRSLGPERGGISNAYVPGRNLVFFSIAAAHAEASGAGEIVSGHVSEDVARFPDVGEEFVTSMNAAIMLGVRPGRTPPRVKMPLRGMSKDQVLREALRLGVPLKDTWSCYNSGSVPCGVCFGCTSRRDAFRAVGVEDPWTETK